MWGILGEESHDILWGKGGGEEINCPQMSIEE